ncbi:hypothetical protein PsorP6_019581 [Peronosclerospora sorghi]|nr:hypothetical protein PsorP6_019581 [Peronosclerospora sorghi]
MNEEYLQMQLPSVEDLQLPVGVNVSKCSLLVADCVSKDQGWASDQREWNGTYRESSSWCEVAVTSPSLGDEGREEKGRALFCPNLRAGTTFRHHRKYFTSSSTLLSLFKLGDGISIVLRSRYPGWTSTAKYARLAACFPVELTDDFSFARILSSSTFVCAARGKTV